MRIRMKMNRRKFINLSATGTAALMINSESLVTSTYARQNNSESTPEDSKAVFKKLGACSSTLFYILNREFGHPKEIEVRASIPLAGGLSGKGHQCGMLWGSALAAGAESFRRQNDRDEAIATAITTTQNIMGSFIKRTNSANCRDIVGCEFTNVFGMAKFMLKTVLHGGINNSICFNLVEKWAPEAIQSAIEGLSFKPAYVSQSPVSCASEVARKMGASDEEIVMVAGFAGGIGLSGNACGALGAAVWIKTLSWCRNNPSKSPPYFNNPEIKKTFEAFYSETNSEILCHKKCSRYFKTIDEHTEFIKNGGCENLINVLARS